MTLRDLTPRQIYNLKRRCEKERKMAYSTRRVMPLNEEEAWRVAFNKGLKAGLELR